MLVELYWKCHFTNLFDCLEETAFYIFVSLCTWSFLTLFLRFKPFLVQFPSAALKCSGHGARFSLWCYCSLNHFSLVLRLKMLHWLGIKYSVQGKSSVFIFFISKLYKSCTDLAILCHHVSQSQLEVTHLQINCDPPCSPLTSQLWGLRFASWMNPPPFLSLLTFFENQLPPFWNKHLLTSLLHKHSPLSHNSSYSGIENIPYCELKTIFPCHLPAAGLPDQKNESSNSLRWWGVHGNISLNKV